MADALAAVDKYLAKGLTKEAVAAAEEANAALKNNDGLRALISATFANKETEKALKMTTDAIAKAGSKPAEGELLITLSDLKLMLEKPKEAMEASKKAEDIFAAAGDKKGQATAMRASIYASLAVGGRKEALKVAKEALKLFKGSDDKEATAASYAMLAHTQLAAGLTDEVPESLDQALTLYKDLGDKAKQASTLSSLAKVYLAKGSSAKIDKALKLSKEASKLFTEVGSEEGALEAWDTTVTAYIAKGEGRGAVKAAKEMATACRKATDAEGQALAERMAIAAELKMGEDENALGLAKKACARLAEAGDWKGQAIMLKCAAELHLKNKRVDLALRCAQEALVLLKANRGKGKEEGEEAELRTIIAEGYVAKGLEPPMTAPRAAALSALQELGQAAEGKQVEAFHAALQKVAKAGGITQKDKDAVLDPIAATDSSAAAFLSSHMPAAEVAKDEQKMSVACLREFVASPGEATHNGVTWFQTMGKMTLTYEVEEGKAETDITVSINQCQLQVNIGGKKVSDLTGDLVAEIIPGHSWWMLHKEDVKRRTRGVDTAASKSTLVIQLAKKDHLAWSKIYYEGDMKHPAVRGKFAWTDEMGNEAAANSLSKLAAIPPGKPQYVSANTEPAESSNFVGGAAFKYGPDDVCVAVDVEQDYLSVTVKVYFDGDAINTVKKSMPFEDLVAADVWENHMSVYLRGDEQNPICWVEFWGKVDPQTASWKYATSQSYRDRQVNMAGCCPVLEIKMPKSKDSQGKWAKTYTNVWQHQLMLKNYAELEEMLLLLQDDAEAQEEDDDEGKLAPEIRDALYDRLMSWKEERYAGMPDAKPFQRAGSDSGDIAANVKKTVQDIAGQTGYNSRARWNKELGRYSYLY